MCVAPKQNILGSGYVDLAVKYKQKSIPDVKIITAS